MRPDHKANLQGSPSTCSVTPSSEVCRQEMPVRGGEGEGGGRLRAGVGRERQQREDRGRGSVNQTSTDRMFCSSTQEERTYRHVPDEQVAGREGEEGGAQANRKKKGEL